MKKNLRAGKKIGYEFQDFSLLEQAMMHSSYTNEKHLEKYHCNERLEFLGCSLELVSSEFYFLNHRKYRKESWQKQERVWCASLLWHFVRGRSNWAVICFSEREKKRQEEDVRGRLWHRMRWRLWSARFIWTVVFTNAKEVHSSVYPDRSGEQKPLFW